MSRGSIGWGVALSFGGTTPQNNIPPEIAKFFQGASGKTFVIKGKPRCGKTTFSLQIATDLVDHDKIFYIATRGTNEPLYSKYPWLKNHDENSKRLESMTPDQQNPPVLQTHQPSPGTSPHTGQQPQNARALLQSILSEPEQQAPGPAAMQQPAGQQKFGSGFKIDRTHLMYLTNQNVPQELEIAYRGIEMNYPGQSMVLINRIDRLAAKYNLNMEALVNTLKRDLVTEASTNLVLVLNKADSALDHLADGIVTLKEFGGGMVFIGQVELNKLLGVEIKMSKYLYNLLDGKFKLLKGITHWG